jgi:arabinogalactan oligomer/maltooligosaccharide transport system substrate-binding protein
LCAGALIAGLCLAAGLLHASASAQASQPITGNLTLWHAYTPGSPEHNALLQVITNALSANPGLTVTAVALPFDQIISQYITQALSGGGPDMLLTSSDELWRMAGAGVIRELDPAVQGRLAGYFPVALQSVSYTGRLYAIPSSPKAVGLFYNKSRIAVPPATTTGLLTMLQSGSSLSVNYSGAYFLYGWYGAFGGQLLDAGGRCIAERGGGVAQAMAYVSQLQAAGAVLDQDYGVSQDQFITGTVDMLVNGPWALPALAPALGANLGLAPLPAGPQAVASPIVGVDSFYINPNTANFTATVELALFMTSQTSVQTFADVGMQVPVRTDVIAADPILNTFAQIAAQGTPRPQSDKFNSYWAPFVAMFDSILAGELGPAAAVAIACNEMNRLNGFPVYRIDLPIFDR